MTKHLDRLMNRTSVAAMAAFAPKPEPVSTIPQFAERVEESAPGGGDREANPIDGLTAEEQAQIDAMNSGHAVDRENVDASADGAGDVPADGDDEDDVAAADGADREAAPAEGGEPRPKPKTISYGRHQKELARAQKERDDLQAQLDGSRNETKKEREDRLRLDERTKVLLEAINTRQAPAAAAAPAADADPEPNVDDDPIGHALWGNRQLRKEIDTLKSGQTKREETTAAQNEERQVYESLVGDIQRAAAADPTMEDAFVHLRETRFQELGYIFADIDINDPKACATLSPADQNALSDNIQKTFHNEQMLVARQSISAGKSPAAVIRNLARARGWQPKAAEPAPGAAPVPAPRVNGNGAPPRPAAPQPSVKDQLSAVRENMDASRSLSDAGGSPGGEITPQRLGEMSAQEFEEYYEVLKANGKLDRMLGKSADM